MPFSPTFVLSLGLALAAPGPPLERIGRLEPPAGLEASGLVKSRRHPGIFWVHGDSGRPPTLFAVRRDGRLVASFTLKVPNVDWEDVAADERGRLYVADTGNNLKLLPVRVIYRLDEPDPSRPAAGALGVAEAVYYRFPAGDRFDAEGLFVHGGRAYLVAKRDDGREAELFSVALEPPAPLIRPAVPERSGRLPGFVEAASGADLSPDGTRLAVCSNSAARVYRWSAATGPALIGEVHYPSSVIEAICWDGTDLILAGEDGQVYRIAEATWRGSGRPGRTLPPPRRPGQGTANRP